MFQTLINLSYVFRYKLPSRSYFSRTVLTKLYSDTYGMVKAELSDVTYFASTTDMWTSRTTDPFMSYTVHWISKDFEMKSRLLQVSSLVISTLT